MKPCESNAHNIKASKIDSVDYIANRPTADDIEAQFKTVSDVVMEILKADRSKKWSTMALERFHLTRDHFRDSLES